MCAMHFAYKSISSFTLANAFALISEKSMDAHAKVIKIMMEYLRTATGIIEEIASESVDSIDKENVVSIQFCKY
jgi:hypothetical protein